LLEIIVVVAIVGITSAIVVVSLDDMLPDAQKDSPYEVLRKAVDTAWYGAATEHTRVTLAYDEDAVALVVRSGESSVPSGESVPSGGKGVFAFNDSRVSAVRFARVPDAEGGTLQTTVTTPFPRLLFSPWGGATPAIIEMDIEGVTFRYRLDPFGGGLEALQ
jgi:type II secretory pathway pseudopilin PulG